MSDCSTQAMTPKEPPKTCGTCAHSESYEVYCPKLNLFIVAKQKARCGLWEDQDGDSRQRRQQLEQVAQEMFSEYRKLFATRMNEEGARKVARSFKSAGEFRERLEALGVNLDE